MTWNELFTRASMFITVLSAAVVALALVAGLLVNHPLIPTMIGVLSALAAAVVMAVIILLQQIRRFTAGLESRFPG